ncbi:MAG TPA: adenylate/guanylate cyclase domain-containing protein [Usitatibacter sp.]
MARFWEGLRGSPRLKGGFLYFVVALLVLAAALLPSPYEAPLTDAERLAFDLQMRALRELKPRPLAEDVVLVGINDDTEAAYPEPYALWHRHFARAYHGLALAKPRAVGVDIVLPEHSYDAIVPGSDLALMRGLVDLKRSAAIVFVQTVNRRGDLVPLQENYTRGILAPENVGIDQQLRDPDSVSRLFSERALSKTGRPVPTLAGQLLRAMGRPVGEGYIDYSLGTPLEYVPLQVLVDRSADAQWLEKQFGGRVVLLGSLIRTTDRWRLPVTLLAKDPGAAIEEGGALDEGNLKYNQPGVLVHLQALRSMLGSGLLSPTPEALRWLLMALAAVAVFLSVRPVIVIALAALVPAALAATSLATIHAAQIVLPIASAIATFWLALVARGIFDAVEAEIDRLRLQQHFAGQVSPAVMKEMLDGTLSPGVSGQLAEVCVLFSDVRDFTTLSEKMPPSVVTTVLQRYFDRMVHAVHRFNGTVDKFIGDGMMILFGAPLKLGNPCGDAVKCALAMMEELDKLNVEFAREGLPTLTIGIGINFGTVTVGNIGSSERHNYSAIGDAVNVAARVEGLTKDLGRKIVITEDVVSRIGEGFNFDPLGSHNVKGHSPVKVWGIRTARGAPAAARAEAIQ